MEMYSRPAIASAKNLYIVQEAIAFWQEAHSSTLDWSQESMSEALLTGLCQQKGQVIRGWLAFKVFFQDSGERGAPALSTRWTRFRQ